MKLLEKQLKKKKLMDNLNFGVVDQKQKESDFDLSQLGSAVEIPESYNTPYSLEVTHQRKIPACGSHAGTHLKNIQEGKNHSPAYLWKRIKQVDGYEKLPPDIGTSMEGIFKALAKFGVCEDKLLPNDTTQSITDYTDPSVITKEMDDNALNYRIGAYAYNWKPTFESLKKDIYLYKAIIVRVEITPDWWTPSWKAKDIFPLKKKRANQGGHFVVLTGYDKDTIYGINSWGDTWGDKGFFYFNEDYMSQVTYYGTCFDYTDKIPYIFTRTLKVGSKGTDVGILQKILKEKGYFPASQSITGFFGRITENAVKAFQKANNLQADGIVGKMTREKLAM